MGSNRRQSSRARKRKAFDETIHPPARTAAEPRSGIPCFYFSRHLQLPIGQLPRPVRCPFCLAVDISIVLDESNPTEGRLVYLARAECEACGCVAGHTSSEDDDVTRRRDADPGSPHSTAFLTVCVTAERWNTRVQA